jgi:hypothetical protein
MALADRRRRTAPPAPAIVDPDENITTTVEQEEPEPAPEPVVAQREPMHSSNVSPEREAAHDAVHDKPRVRTRQRHATVQDSPFDLPRDEIPEGSSYEWKRYSVSGLTADTDPFYLASMRRQGWEPVDPKRHPNWIPDGYDKPYLVRDGLILMERPMELTLEARKEVRDLSRQQVREAEQRLGLAPKDTMTRNFDGVRPQIVKEVGRMIPVEE